MEALSHSSLLKESLSRQWAVVQKPLHSLLQYYPDELGPQNNFKHAVVCSQRVCNDDIRDYNSISYATEDRQLQ